MAGAPMIPEILTNKDWQKKKGVFAKMAGTTGVGAAMDDMKKAYVKVDFAKMNVIALIGPSKLIPALDAARLEAVKYVKGKEISDLRSAIQKVSKKAKEAEATFKKSKTIPKDAGAHAKKVQDEADKFFVAVGDHGLYFDACMKEFDAHRQKLAEIAQASVASVSRYVSLIESDAKVVLANPTATEYIGAGTKGFFQDTRGMQAGLAVLMQCYPDAKPHRDAFMNVSQDGYKPKNDASPEEIKKKVAEVVKITMDVKKALSGWK